MKEKKENTDPYNILQECKQGETVALRYRTETFLNPFSVNVETMECSQEQYMIKIYLRSHFSENVEVLGFCATIDFPSTFKTYSYEFYPYSLSQRLVHDKDKHQCLWYINRISGSTEYQITLKVKYI